MRLVPFALLDTDDVIIAIDGHELPAPRIVEGTRRDDGALRLVRPGPNPHAVQWWLYPATGEQYGLATPRTPTYNVGPAPDEDTFARLALAIPRIRMRFTTARNFWERIAPFPGAQPALDAQVGDVIAVPGEYWRAAVVLGVGPKRYRVAYTTPHGVREHHATGRGLAVTGPYIPRGDAYRAPARWFGG